MKKKWLKNKLAGLALAFSSVEKTTFSQGGESTRENVSHTRRNTEGQLMDSLLNGVVTQEVMDLRWRLYKGVQEAEKYITKATYDKVTGEFLGVETRLKDLSNELNNITVEPSDDYPIELVVDNSDITMSVLGAMGEVNEDKRSLDAMSMGAALKVEKPILIEREFRPKFDIESYTNKLHVRKISDTERLLEFYVSKYPDEFNRTTRLFIGEVKKAMTNPELCNMLLIKEVGFISYNTVGANNHCEFHYEVTKFDKIVEFNGDYVIKFKANVLTNGENILAKYMQEELETKYKNKEKRIHKQ